jgi:hypothetical protein
MVARRAVLSECRQGSDKAEQLARITRHLDQSEAAARRMLTPNRLKGRSQRLLIGGSNTLPLPRAWWSSNPGKPAGVERINRRLPSFAARRAKQSAMSGMTFAFL